MRTFLLTCAGLFVLMTPVAHAFEPAPNPQPAVSQFAAISAHDQVREMGRGVNIIGSDPFWEAPGKSSYTPGHFARLRAAGFSNVRLVLFTQTHLDARGRLDPKWLNRVDWLVATAKANDLTIVRGEAGRYLEPAGHPLQASTQYRPVRIVRAGRRFRHGQLERCLAQAAGSYPRDKP